jgi:hypothetical protein
LADGGGNTSDGAPGVHDSLAAGDGAASLQGAVFEASHHLERTMEKCLKRAALNRLYKNISEITDICNGV